MYVLIRKNAPNGVCCRMNSCFKENDGNIIGHSSQEGDIDFREREKFANLSMRCGGISVLLESEN